MLTLDRKFQYRPDAVTRTGVIKPYDIRQVDPVDVARGTITPFIEGIRRIGVLLSPNNPNQAQAPLAGVSYPTAARPVMQSQQIRVPDAGGSVQISTIAQPSFANGRPLPRSQWHGRGRPTSNGPHAWATQNVPFPTGQGIPMPNVDYPTTSVPSVGPGVAATYSAGFGRAQMRGAGGLGNAIRRFFRGGR